jgi:hypothetical protein
MIGPTKPTRSSGRFARSVSPDMDGRFERNWRAVSSICDNRGISDGPWPSAFHVSHRRQDSQARKRSRRVDS